MTLAITRAAYEALCRLHVDGPGIDPEADGETVFVDVLYYTENVPEEVTPTEIGASPNLSCTATDLRDGEALPGTSDTDGYRLQFKRTDSDSAEITVNPEDDDRPEIQYNIPSNEFLQLIQEVRQRLSEPHHDTVAIRERIKAVAEAKPNTELNSPMDWFEATVREVLPPALTYELTEELAGYGYVPYHARYPVRWASQWLLGYDGGARFRDPELVREFLDELESNEHVKDFPRWAVYTRALCAPIRNALQTVDPLSVHTLDHDVFATKSWSEAVPVRAYAAAVTLLQASGAQATAKRLAEESAHNVPSGDYETAKEEARNADYEHAGQLWSKLLAPSLGVSGTEWKYCCGNAAYYVAENLRYSGWSGAASTLYAAASSLAETQEIPYVDRNATVREHLSAGVELHLAKQTSRAHDYFDKAIEAAVSPEYDQPEDHHALLWAVDQSAVAAMRRVQQQGGEIPPALNRIISLVDKIPSEATSNVYYERTRAYLRGVHLDLVTRLANDADTDAAYPPAAYEPEQAPKWLREDVEFAQETLMSSGVPSWRLADPALESYEAVDRGYDAGQLRDLIMEGTAPDSPSTDPGRHKSREYVPSA